MISPENRHNIYGQALGKWGIHNQLLVAIEEMSEVQKAITKFIRCSNEEEEIKKCAANIIEEVADATIMLEQLKYYFGMNAEVEEMMDKKILRLKERISNGTV